MPTKQNTLGNVMKRIRSRNDWTLAQMSEKSGIPLSTLSKIERDLLTLTYDKMVSLSQRLKIPLPELFSGAETAEPSIVTGRRSVADCDRATRVNTSNYDYYYLCTELREKRMIPIIVQLHARTLEEFGELVTHDGEEFIYVVDGVVTIHTAFYDPVTLRKGQGMYIDGPMGHACLVGDGSDGAVILSVCSAGQVDLQRELIAAASAERRLAPPPARRKRNTRT